MKRILVCGFAVIGVATILADCGRGAEQVSDENGFVSLFDGKSLEGWDGDAKIFRVQDNAIVGGTLKERIAAKRVLEHQERVRRF